MRATPERDELRGELEALREGLRAPLVEEGSS